MSSKVGPVLANSGYYNSNTSTPNLDKKKKKRFGFLSRSGSKDKKQSGLRGSQNVPLVGRTFSTTLKMSPQVSRTSQPSFLSDSSLAVKEPLQLNGSQMAVYNSLLLVLPEELLDYICSYLSHSDFGHFRLCCKDIYQRTACQAKERKLYGISCLMHTNPDNVWLFAIRKKDLDILNYLRLNYPGTVGECVVEEVLVSFSPEVFSWMNMNYPMVFRDNRLTEKAAMTGNLMAVKTLHKLCPAGCTEAAMNAAVWNGHYKLAKWFDKKHSNLATERTFALAIIAGHLSIMKMLYMRHMKFRRNEFVESMRGLALQKGRLPLAEWLVKVKEFERAAVTTATVAGGAAIALAMCTIS